MGQKVNPHGLRVALSKVGTQNGTLDKKNFADNLVEDNKIRKFVKKNFSQLVFLK